MQQVEQAVVTKPDQIRLVSELVKLIGDEGADPYTLIGVLLEGAVHTLATHIPPQRQRETTERLGRILVERLKAHGLA
jgi:hypothetical protein